MSKFLFEIACSASSSTDVDALKFWLIQYDKFYSGEQQEDASIGMSYDAKRTYQQGLSTILWI